MKKKKMRQTTFRDLHCDLMPHSSDRGLGTLARVYQFILGLSRRKNVVSGRESRTKYSVGAAEESKEGQVE